MQKVRKTKPKRKIRILDEITALSGESMASSGEGADNYVPSSEEKKGSKIH